MSKFPLRYFHDFTSKEARQLLHNKFVVILGDSIHRTIYKDLICFLQKEKLLTQSELKAKGEERVCNDHRVEWGGLHNKTSYREVRQYRTDHHLIRAYFLTRVYSSYMESILDDFRAGPLPDLVILNSCLWDLNRYLDSSNAHPLQKAFREYRQNLQTLFQKLQEILPPSCLVIWDTAMPVASRVRNAYLEQGMKNKSTPKDVLRANFEGATLACCYQFDILDLNFCFRFLTVQRYKDGVHWSQRVHRFITKLLLTHVANAWGVELKKRGPQSGIAWNGNGAYQHHSPLLLPLRPPPPAPLWSPPPEPPFAQGLLSRPNNFEHDLDFQCDSIPVGASTPSFSNFEDVLEPPACWEELQQGGFHRPDGRWDVPHHPLPPFHAEVPDGRRDVPHHPLPLYHVEEPDGRWRGPPAFPCRSPQGSHGRHRRVHIVHPRRFRPYDRNGPGGHLPFQEPPYQGPRGL